MTGEKNQADSADKEPTETYLIPLRDEGPGEDGRKGGGWVPIAAAVLAVAAVGGGLGYFLSRPPGGTAAPAAPPHGASAAVRTLLRLHGSNTIGDALMPALVTAYLQRRNYTDVRVEPTDKPDEVYVVGQRSNGATRVEIMSRGSETGFQDLIAGTADIAMSSEKINDAQLALAARAKLGDLASTAGEHVIALDGVTAIVHPLNTVPSLTLAQLADVFSGGVTDWSGVGGTGGPITVFARDDNSGTWNFFADEVLKKHGRTLPPGTRRFERSVELANAVTGDPQSVGIIGLTYVGANRAVGLSDQGVQARVPTNCTVKTEEYVLTRRLYLYTPVNMPPDTSGFITFATSRDAWQTVEKAGMVNLDPTPLPNCNGPSQGRHSADWTRLTAGKTRLLANFNFLTDSFTLDTKAHLSLKYITDLLAGGTYGHHKVLLIGYTDAVGTPDHNKTLSEKRALAVKDALARALSDGGLSVTIEAPQGLGEQDYLAPNTTPEGRQKNRRVEVWLD